MATYVVNAGLDITTNRLKGAGTEPLYIGWGVSAGTTAKTDTTLFGERLVDLATAAGTDHTAGTSTRVLTTVANDSYQVTGTRTATGVGADQGIGQLIAAVAGGVGET